MCNVYMDIYAKLKASKMLWHEKKRNPHGNQGSIYAHGFTFLLTISDSSLFLSLNFPFFMQCLCIFFNRKIIL